MRQKNYNFYHNLGYWFLLLIVLVFAGFYTTYFSVFFQPTATIIHIHFTLMVVWIAMLIAQPFLIKFKKLFLHRALGKISYVLVPLVLLSGFLMIRHSYYLLIENLRQKAAQGLNQLDSHQILQEAAYYEAIAIFYLTWFALFYSLAIINRRKSAIHARFMLATALPLLGPTVDRIVIFNFKLPSYLPYELPSFLLIDTILVLLLWHDYQNKRSTKTIKLSLIIYLTGQLLYFIVPHTEWWQQVVTFIMKPEP
ncbi:MAG: hypothetical protein V4683_04840 [Bacteroidota bacterium]